ncbi:hypothetical protein KC980_02315 [candidate division WWE3 bacterium]|uniref:Uncharacterized protein n=1 Tax=candidate division WWE3 bacterium TaxID=2053526 RepID=A0A955ED20_UNCKA|nr:hypothetical protein [candidate division WWE3 bacterium]
MSEQNKSAEQIISPETLNTEIRFYEGEIPVLRNLLTLFKKSKQAGQQPLDVLKQVFNLTKK